jgi:serine/threonine protein kinase/Tfp pilus assembly protein PilF
MQLPFEKLTETLQTRGISPSDYRDFLNYLYPEEAEQILLLLQQKNCPLPTYKNLAQVLEQKGVNLSQYRDYLNGKYPGNLSISQPSTQIQRAIKNSPSEWNALQWIGNHLISTGKLHLQELNNLLKELPPGTVVSRKVLYLLLKRKKIHISEFLAWDPETEENEKKISSSDMSEQSFKLKFSEDGYAEFFQEEAPRTHRQKFGNYEVLEEIGRGGMGIIYKAYHPILKQVFALKVLIAGEDASELALKRFHREIQASAKLRHPGIIQTTDSGQEGGYHYFVMEYVEGKTLGDRIKEGLELREGILCIQKCLEALHHAHHEGIIHRDLKPDNIFMTSNGEAKIGDFGLARDSTLDSKSQKLTNTRSVIGTPIYMSPEQAQGEANTLDARSDIYSMGACLYQVLTQRPPFQAPNVHLLFAKIIHQDPPLPSTLNSEVHRDLELIVLKALEKSKEARYQNALAFAKDLGRFLNGYPILARPTTPLEQGIKWIKRNRQRSLLLLGFSLLFFCFWFYRNWEQARSVEQRFQYAYQEVQDEKQKLSDLEKKGTLRKGEKLQFLLNTLNLLNRALALTPKTLPLEQEKGEIGKILVDLSCENQEYQLAEYVAKELQNLTALSDSDKKKLLYTVEQARTRSTREHLQSLEDWIQHLQSNTVEDGDAEDAVFDISKMPEREVFERLLKLLEEGTQYFLQTRTARTSTQNQFFEAMAVALGRLENEQATVPLIHSLKRLSQKLAPLAPYQQESALLNYMITLTQALETTQAKGILHELAGIRQVMGKGSLYSQKTLLSYRKLARLQIQNPKETATPKEYAAWAYASFDQGQGETTLYFCNKILKLESTRTEIQLLKAQALVFTQQKKDSEALKDLEKALELEPHFPLLDLQRGKIYAQKEQLQEAFSAYQQELQKYPTQSLAYYERALLYQKIGSVNEALQDFREALRLDPQNATIYWACAQLYSQQKKDQEALKDLKNALTLNPCLWPSYLKEPAPNPKENQILGFSEKELLPFPPSPPEDPPLIVRLLVLNFAPFISSNQRIYETLQWYDPRTLTQEYLRNVFALSRGKVRYELVYWYDLDYFTSLIDGFVYTGDTLISVYQKKQKAHEPEIADFAKAFNQLQLIPLIEEQNIDEIWFFSPPFLGYPQSCMIGPEAYWINGDPLTQIKTKKNFVLMGFNYERNSTQMLHNLAHRLSATLQRIYGKSSALPPFNVWEKFSTTSLENREFTGVGTCCIPPNGEHSFDYENPRSVSSLADAFLQYPDLSLPPQTLSCETWGGPDYEENYIKWWFTRIPKAPGKDEEEREQNWWKYVYRFQHYDAKGLKK